jgi:two-component system response regulator DevR
MERIKIIVVDDHEMVREGLKAILEPEQDFLVVGEAGTGNEVVELATRTRADVALLDARLPDSSGPEVCRALKLTGLKVRVIIMSTYTDDELVQASISAGARGYVVKNIERFSLKECIRAVHRGQAVLSPQVTGSLMDRMFDDPPPGPRVNLNQSQVAILRLIARGYSNREIAAEVHLSENTVKTHLQGIFSKLGVRNRVEAAMLASRKHLV